MERLPEITGIPEEEQEDPESLVIALGEKIGVNCVSNDIQACHCIGPRNDAATICKFQNRK